jgi:hypothetical protein
MLGLNLGDAQTRMGRHAGERWKNMDSAEMDIYTTLNAAEEARLKRF